jgi:hypothetical protein
VKKKLGIFKKVLEILMALIGHHRLQRRTEKVKKYTLIGGMGALPQKFSDF